MQPSLPLEGDNTLYFSRIMYVQPVTGPRRGTDRKGQRVTANGRSPLLNHFINEI